MIPAANPRDIDGIISNDVTLVLDRDDFQGFIRLALIVEDDDTGIGQDETIFGFGSNAADTVRAAPVDPGNPNAGYVVTIQSDNGTVQRQTVHSGDTVSLALANGVNDFDAGQDVPVRWRIFSGVEPDRIRTSGLDDYVDPGPGDDVVITEGGDDVILACSGNDTVYSGTGSDNITAVASVIRPLSKTIRTAALTRLIFLRSPPTSIRSKVLPTTASRWIFPSTMEPSSRYAPTVVFR